MTLGRKGEEWTRARQSAQSRVLPLLPPFSSRPSPSLQAARRLFREGWDDSLPGGDGRNGAVRAQCARCTAHPSSTFRDFARNWDRKTNCRKRGSDEGFPLWSLVVRAKLGRSQTRRNCGTFQLPCFNSKLGFKNTQRYSKSVGKSEFN